MGRPAGATSRAFEHCQRIYAAMAAVAVPATGGDDVAAIFVGNLLPLMVSLGYTSTEQYHSRKRELLAMGCIRQLRRGTRYRLGAWALLRPPTPELWAAQVGRPFTYRREAAVREQHERDLRRLFEHLPGRHPELLAELVAAGARTAPEVIAHLAGLPETRLRALFPAGEVCLGYLGGPHTCRTPDLDPLAPSTSAGAWRRRADHLAKLR